MATGLLTSFIQNHRGHTETFPAYRRRLRQVNRRIRDYLRYGIPAIESREKPHREEAARKYEVGPHRTHRPHEIKRFIPVPVGVSKTGVLITKQVEIKGQTRGTLVKAPTSKAVAYAPGFIERMTARLTGGAPA